MRASGMSPPVALKNTGARAGDDFWRGDRWLGFGTVVRKPVVVSRRRLDREGPVGHAGVLERVDDGCGIRVYLTPVVGEVQAEIRFPGIFE